MPKGSCCANCYIQHVSLASALQDAKILNVADLENRKEDGSGEVVEIFGHCLDTTKGSCTIEMRVEHNGPYYGWLGVRKNEPVPISAKPLDDF